MAMQNYNLGSGLSNLGNTCFFNSVMQVLFHTESLAHYFSSNEHKNSCQSPNWCILCGLENLWHETKKKKVCLPLGIIQNLKTIFKKFRFGRQEDSHEFLRHLIEAMQEVETGKLGREYDKNEQKIVRTKTFRVFGGRMRNCILCHNCGYKSLTSERYYDLNIECLKSKNLKEGLNLFFQSEELKDDNKYYCEKCETQSDATKSLHLITVPETVTFQIKRFTNSLRKIGKIVQYPKSLNIGKYFEEPIESYQLQLYAVIVHYGFTSSTGHYYTYVKWNGDWYEMNDSRIRQCSEERALGQQAYMIFYKRITPKALVRRDSILNQSEEQKVVEEEKQEEEEKKVKKESKKSKKKEDDLPDINLKLKRRKSKQQALSEMSLQQMLFKYSSHLLELETKLPKQGKRPRSFQPVYNLRKYEIIMKKRKLT